MPIPGFIISGTVKDTDNSTALAGANMRILNIRSKEILETTTDTDGSFSQSFTSYLNKDMIFIEAKKSISDFEVKIGISVVEIDTSLPGIDTTITVDLKVDRKVNSVVLRTPLQEREDRMFSPDYDALRVLPTGFNKEQTTITRDSNNLISEIQVSDGIHTKIITLTRDSNNQVTNISERIK